MLQENSDKLCIANGNIPTVSSFTFFPFAHSTALNAVLMPTIREHVNQGQIITIDIGNYSKCKICMYYYIKMIMSYLITNTSITAFLPLQNVRLYSLCQNLLHHYQVNLNYYIVITLFIIPPQSQYSLFNLISC